MEQKLKEIEKAETKRDIGVQKMSLRTFLMRYNAIIILVFLCIIASGLSPLFISKTNLFTLLRQRANKKAEESI